MPFLVMKSSILIVSVYCVLVDHVGEVLKNIKLETHLNVSGLHN